MSIQSFHSSKPDLQQAVNEIVSGIKLNKPRFVLYFCSSVYNSKEAAGAVKKAFPSADVIGCTTAGEITSGKMLNNSIALMAFDNKSIEDVKIEIIENLTSNPEPQKAFESFEKYYGIKSSDMDFQKYLGLILVDGLSGAEENLMDIIGAKTNVFFVGGSAGDDVKFKITYVFANGKEYTDAAVLALLKPKAGFDIIKTQSFKALDKKFIATKVNEAAREIVELDGKPAAEVYAAAVGKPVAEAANEFMSHPLGVMIGEEPFVRSPQQLIGTAIKFYCNVAEGTELTLLESQNIIADTKLALEKKEKEFGKFGGLINFNCILRKLELENKNITAEYGKLFSDFPTVGFSTYGEEYIGHINQTSVIAVFK